MTRSTASHGGCVDDWWGFTWMILAEVRGALTPEKRAAAWCSTVRRRGGRDLPSANDGGKSIEAKRDGSAAKMAAAAGPTRIAFNHRGLGPDWGTFTGP
jgi:hypothetical protein